MRYDFFSQYAQAYDIKVGILQISTGRLYHSAPNLIKQSKKSTVNHLTL